MKYSLSNKSDEFEIIIENRTKAVKIGNPTYGNGFIKIPEDDDFKFTLKIHFVKIGDGKYSYTHTEWMGNTPWYNDRSKYEYTSVCTAYAKNVVQKGRVIKSDEELNDFIDLLLIATGTVYESYLERSYISPNEKLIDYVRNHQSDIEYLIWE